MGVFTENDQQDAERIGPIIEGFQEFWNSRPIIRSSKLRLLAKPENLDTIARYSNGAFGQFEGPSHFQRMAAFVVLTTICPCFSIEVGGKILTHPDERRWFFARVNLFLLPLLFKLLEGEKIPNWPGYPPMPIAKQIIEVLTRMDISDLVNPNDFSHQIKGLAKDILALSLIIQLWVEYGSAEPPSETVETTDDIDIHLRNCGFEIGSESN